MYVVHIRLMYDSCNVQIVQISRLTSLFFTPYYSIYILFCIQDYACIYSLFVGGFACSGKSARHWIRAAAGGAVDCLSVVLCDEWISKPWQLIVEDILFATSGIQIHTVSIFNTLDSSAVKGICTHTHTLILKAPWCTWWTLMKYRFCNSFISRYMALVKDYILYAIRINPCLLGFSTALMKLDLMIHATSWQSVQTITLFFYLIKL